jgi:cell division septation protein DedD
MEDKTKLFVFDRLEVVIIFLFMVVLAITCFTLGIRVGKKYAIRMAGYTTEDVRQVDMKSTVEEDVDSVIEQNKNNVIEEKVKSGNLQGSNMDRLKEELQELDEKPQMIEQDKQEVQQEVAKQKQEAKKEAKDEAVSSPLIGKYTIQLGSYQGVEDAKVFAEGFRARGYNPIINEVVIQNKGIWYRVSLGVFENVTEAKKYIDNEQSLFQGQDYVITEIR